jgi:hypothetical protein
MIDEGWVGRTESDWNYTVSECTIRLCLQTRKLNKRETEITIEYSTYSFLFCQKPATTKVYWVGNKTSSQMLEVDSIPNFQTQS